MFSHYKEQAGQSVQVLLTSQPCLRELGAPQRKQQTGKKTTEYWN